ncbi:hypothetical protein [Burkholderia metallica]|uniref:hypothetical protein n=1 Tax=Burkholderia metallica TaxID=488729 RepID=UPI001CF39F0E|nr:hypothetical protein [Burkholderia metallica]
MLPTREVWIDAYLTGNVEQLAYVESAHFFVKHGDLTKTKQQQLARLRSFAAEHVSRMSGVTYVDESRCITGVPRMGDDIPLCNLHTASVGTAFRSYSHDT